MAVEAIEKKATLDSLKEFANQYCHDGVVRLNVSKRADGGYKLDFVEDDYVGDLVDKDGNIIVEDYRVVTTCFVLYTSGENQTVGFIEHPYGAITAANVHDIKALTSLIGVSVDVDDTMVKDEIELKSEKDKEEVQ